MLKVLPLIAFAMIFYGLGEYFSKLYADEQRKLFAALALSGYFLNAVLFLPALTQFNSLARLGTIWNILYAVITLVVAVVLFGEPLANRQCLGISLGLSAILLLA